MASSHEEVYDLIGIGFGMCTISLRLRQLTLIPGPANLALAIALRESQEASEAQVRCAFLEKQPHFAW